MSTMIDRSPQEEITDRDEAYFLHVSPLMRLADVPKRGMRCEVLRGHPDHRPGLQSDEHYYMVLVGPGIPELVEPDDESPAIFCATKFTEGEPYYHACPLRAPAPGFRSWTAGGNFLYSADSRFPSRQPIPIHDREERPI